MTPARLVPPLPRAGEGWGEGIGAAEHFVAKSMGPEELCTNEPSLGFAPRPQSSISNHFSGSLGKIRGGTRRLRAPSALAQYAPVASHRASAGGLV
jgi:hypothetical protein